ncbi:MAG: TetR family transcriptional regulator [Spirochaetales bacterium]|nr:TetR family transcriptional regulator [Spirochaetales bacterium]
MLFDDVTSEEGSKEKIILEAAMDEFIAEGWAGARMQSIADRAGINKPLLHYYFRSKEKLYNQTVYRVMAYFFGFVLGNVEGKDSFQEFLRAFIDSVIDETAENPRIPLFIMQELSRGGETIRGILSQVLSEQNPPVTEVMRTNLIRAMETGEIRPVNPIQFIMSLLGSCLYFVMAEPIIMELGKQTGLLGNFDRSRFLEERKEAVFTLLYNGVRS